AVEAASRGDVSLVLLDLILPKLNGFEVLLRLKANAATADVPVIVLTNLGQYSDIQRAREQGAAGYMIKGEMDLGELVARVETVLAGQKPR
ncbi:MAG: response regulator, partial [Terriglobales bacterium]